MNTVRERVEFKLPEKQLKKLDTYAETIGETRSTVIRRAINYYVDKKIDDLFKREEKQLVEKES